MSNEEHTYLRREPVYTDLMVTLEEGGEWYHVRIHSLVLQGHRWDARTPRFSKNEYNRTPDEDKELQLHNHGRVFRLVPSV